MSFIKHSRDIFLKGPVAFLPSRVVTNDEICALLGAKVRGSWIERKTGVQSRRWAAPNEACSDLAVAAALQLFEKFPGEQELIRLLVLATISGDYPTPPTSPLVQDRLGLKECGAFDLGAACAGFVSGLHTAGALQVSSQQNMLLIAADIRSKFLNNTDFATMSLFGDGAAACLLSSEEKNADFKLLATQLFADGSVADIISIPSGGSRSPAVNNQDAANFCLSMKNTVALFLAASSGMAEAALTFLKNLDVQAESINWVVPHQANLHLMQEVAKQLPIPKERWIETISYTGNTSGASVGIALSTLLSKHPVRKGDRILLVSAGGGGLATCGLLESIRDT